MMNFIAIDIENFKVDLYDEEEFIAAYEAEALDPEDYKSDEDRITELVEDNYCDIAWSRQDAVDKIIEEIELLSIEEGGDDETRMSLLNETIRSGSLVAVALNFNLKSSKTIQPNFSPSMRRISNHSGIRSVFNYQYLIN